MSLKIVLGAVAVILVLAHSTTSYVLPHNLTAFETQVQKGVNLLVTKGIVGADLQSTLGTLDLHHLFYDDAHLVLNNGLLCAACSVLGNGLIKARRDGATREDMYNFARNLCVHLHIQAEHVCHGVIESNVDIILYVIDHNEEIDGSRFCSVVLQGSECKAKVEPTWMIDIHDGESPKGKAGSGESFNILHMTDIHYDPLYQEGSLAKCDHPMCCQYDSGDVVNEEDAAHYWTEYNSCDVSDYLLEDTLRHLTGAHDLEYVYYTGDIISHRVWATDAYNNTEDLRYVYSQFRKYFGDTPVFPVLGNHEPHPLNVWAPNDVEQDISTKWVFEVVAEEWSHWLGDECKETIRAGGYYTKLVKPGFRVVGLNSNVAYIMNWWLLYNDVDNFGQLAWLENVLYEAEQNGESVHILSHIPSGDGSAYAYWQAQFFKLVLRYQNTITGIFNGHTHNDEMVIYHNGDGTAVKVVAYNGGSLTPYSRRNPNYRILKIDTENYDVLDYDQFMFNVEEANKDREKSPEWFKQYSFKEAYGVKSLFGEDVSELTRRMAEEPSKALLKQYINFRNRDGPKSYDPCDENCMKTFLSNLVVPFFGDKTHSDKLMTLWKYEEDA